MKTHLARGAVYLTLSSIIFLISGYIINIWLGRFLGPSIYGTYGIIMTVVTLINIMQTSGLPQAVVKYVAEDETFADGILKSALTLQILSGVIITISLFLFSDFLAYLLHDPSLSIYIKISSFIFPLYGIFSLYIGYYNGLHNFSKQALMNIIYGIVKTVIVFILAYILHLQGIIYGFILAPLFPLLFGFRLPKITSVTFSYRKLIYFSLPLIGFAAFSTLQSSVDLIFIKALLPSDESAGYYTASQNISRVPYFILSALSLVLLPNISKSVSQNLEEKTKNIINRALLYILILLVPGTLILSITSGQLIELLYSQTYLPAASALSVLLIGAAFFTIFSLLANILNGAGSPIKSMAISILGVIITMLLCPLLIPMFGLLGAAFSTTSGSFVTMIVAAVTVYKRFKAFVPIKSIVKILFATLVIYILTKFILFPLFFLPFLYFFLFATYICLLILMKELTKKDLDLVVSILPKRIRSKLEI